MNSPAFENFTTEQIKKRKRLTTLALNLVWIGACIGILAAVSRLFTNGAIEETTLLFSLITILVSVPVYRERKRIDHILSQRSV
tara:strand:- start:1096 stop:1347 length:252 start_codon:yes stop_codon:yes gene_type:complete